MRGFQTHWISWRFFCTRLHTPHSLRKKRLFWKVDLFKFLVFLRVILIYQARYKCDILRAPVDCRQKNSRYCGSGLFTFLYGLKIKEGLIYKDLLYMETRISSSKNTKKTAVGVKIPLEKQRKINAAIDHVIRGLGRDWQKFQSLNIK